MKTTNDEYTGILNDLKPFAATRLQLIEYQAVAKVAPAAGDIAVAIAVLFCYLLTFVFASITLGFVLSDLLGAGWTGFGGLALIYILTAALVLPLKIE